jgi:hypothetical protein
MRVTNHHDRQQVKQAERLDQKGIDRTAMHWRLLSRQSSPILLSGGERTPNAAENGYSERDNSQEKLLLGIDTASRFQPMRLRVGLPKKLMPAGKLLDTLT